MGPHGATEPGYGAEPHEDMSSVTGIELGPDYCVLVQARLRADTIQCGPVRVFGPGRWPRQAAARAALLSEARRELGLTTRAWVVNWQLNSSTDRPASPDTPPREAEDVVKEAGFEPEAILTPSQALALLGGSREPEAGSAEAALYLSLNHHGAALVAVRGFETLYSREFSWQIAAPEQRTQASLLRRYLIVAQLTPEIRRAVEAVRTQYGIAVDSAVTCGTIPDVRTLTMPLIAELNIEFETMDSSAGLDGSGESAAVVAEWAPALRLAWVSAAAGVSRGREIALGRWLGAAAAAVLAVGAAWWGFALWSDTARSATAVPVQTAPVLSAPQANRQEPAAQPASTATPPAPRSVTVAPRPTGVQGAQSTSGSAAGGEALKAVGSQPLDAPLPIVSGILISSDKQFAVIDGAVVSAGDRIGPRVVVRIEPAAVVLREPSGREVRVPVRGKVGAPQI